MKTSCYSKEELKRSRKAGGAKRDDMKSATHLTNGNCLKEKKALWRERLAKWFVARIKKKKHCQIVGVTGITRRKNLKNY